MDPQEARQEAQAVLRSRLWKEVNRIASERKRRYLNTAMTMQLSDPGSILEREKVLGRHDECLWLVETINNVAKLT